MGGVQREISAPTFSLQLGTPHFELDVGASDEAFEELAKHAVGGVPSTPPSRSELGHNRPPVQRKRSACEEEERVVARQSAPGSPGPSAPPNLANGVPR